MRQFGRFLVIIGVVVGIATGTAILTGTTLPGIESWLARIAVAKLTFITSLGLIAVGTVLQRAADRRAGLILPHAPRTTASHLDASPTTNAVLGEGPPSAVKPGHPASPEPARLDAARSTEGDH